MKNSHNKREDDDTGAANTMRNMILFGGDSRVGYLTNPKNADKSPFITVNGEKVVCTAKGGECRFNFKYYGSGSNDPNFWKTPLINNTCPNQCPYKMIVCDDHKPRCEGSVEYYPEYNKFLGLFGRYCRNLSKLEDKAIEV